MSNPKGNPNFKPKWLKQPTTTIRVPQAFVEAVLDLCRRFDNNTLQPDEYFDLMHEEAEKTKRAMLEHFQARLPDKD